MTEVKKEHLARLIHILSGFAFDSRYFTKAEALPLIRIRDLNRQTTEVNYSGEYKREYVVDNGDLLIGMDGDFEVVRWKGQHALLNQRVCKLWTNDPTTLNQTYLFYSLIDEIKKIHQQVSATTVKHLSIKHLEKIEIPLPEIDEQSKIAEVLTAVDHTITQTGHLIAKYQRIKTGLMQDLLTRGIDENGRLRDPATHEFKDSPIGPIPQEWEAITLGEVVANSRGTIQTGPFGSQLHAHEYTHEGIPIIMPQDMLEDGSINFQQTARIPSSRADDLKRHFVKANDVVFARRGDLSRCVAIHKDNIGLCGTGCILVRIPKETLSGTWLSLIYRHEQCQRQIAARAVGSTMVNLNTQLLANLIIAKPNVEEQHKISIKLENFNHLIDVEVTHLKKLKKVKTGLMQDLLTGKVSVAPLLAEVGV